MSITAIIVMPDGDRRPCLVSSRLVSPTEIIQILEQKKMEMGFAWVEEIAGPKGKLKYQGTAEQDAVAMLIAGMSFQLPRRQLHQNTDPLRRVFSFQCLDANLFI